MAHTISVHDDETRITAAMTVDDSGARPRITEIRFTADDEVSVTANDLLLVRFFGLTLPGGTATTATVSAINAAARDATNGKPPTPRLPAKKAPVPVRKAPVKERRFTGKRPDDATLLKLWLDNERSAAFVARKVGCSSQTVFAWIAAAKARGTEFPAKP
jgi:hypothetical protein